MDSGGNRTRWPCCSLRGPPNSDARRGGRRGPGPPRRRRRGRRGARRLAGRPGPWRVSRSARSRGTPAAARAPDGVGQHRPRPSRCASGPGPAAAGADELERGGLRLAAVRAQDGGGVDLGRAALGQQASSSSGRSAHAGERSGWPTRTPSPPRRTAQHPLGERAGSRPRSSTSRSTQRAPAAPARPPPGRPGVRPSRSSCGDLGPGPDVERDTLLLQRGAQGVGALGHLGQDPGLDEVADVRGDRHDRRSRRRPSAGASASASGRPGRPVVDAGQEVEVQLGAGQGHGPRVAGSPPRAVRRARPPALLPRSEAQLTGRRPSPS